MRGGGVKVDIFSTQGCIMYLLHYLLGVHTHPTHPPPAYGPGRHAPFA